MTAAPKLSYEIIPQDGYTTVKLHGQLDAESADAFRNMIDTIDDNSCKDFLIHCGSLRELIAPWIRVLMSLHQKLKLHDKKVRLLEASEDLQKFLKREGIDTSLKVASSLKAAKIDFGLVKEKVLDVDFINPFLSATITVLKTQASTEANAGQVYRKASRDKFLGDISGVIGLVSEAFTGSVVISFPAPTFLNIMSRMLGEEYKEITKEIEDGAGELTNIIFGQAKIILNERGYGIKTALPSVITGQNHSILQMSNGPRVIIPFNTDIGPFFVEICTSGQTQ